MDAVPNVPEEFAECLEIEIRGKHGGGLVYITKRPPDLHAWIARHLSTGATPVTVMRRYGVSRSTVFRAKKGRAPS